MAAKEEVAGVSISKQDQKDILDLHTKIRATEAKLVGPDGKTQLLPTNLYSFLCQVLGDLKAGKSVTILQSNASLTTLEAAKLLAVSRQFLVQLLAKNEIPFHMVGMHRRLYAHRPRELADGDRVSRESGVQNRGPASICFVVLEWRG